MLSWRVASALVGIPLLLLVTYVGGWWLVGLTAAAALAGVGEMGRLVPDAGRPARALAAAAALAVPALALVRPGAVGEAAVAGAALLLAAEAAAAAGGDAAAVRARGRAVGAGLLLLIYPSFLFAYLVRLRAEAGVAAVWWTLAVVWAADTAAYFAGTWRGGRGGRRLAPGLSPGKTVAGAAAGLAAAVALGAGYGAAGPGLPVWAGGLAGLLVGVAALAGDLAESLLKRAAGTKDAGRLIPGHGGVLDRADSLALGLPAAYYLFYLLRP